MSAEIDVSGIDVMSDDLAVAVARLVGQVQHWTPARWAKPAEAGGTRADVVHGLAQRLADAAADATGEPRRPVPRLENDLALPDQLRVLCADLVAAPASAAQALALDDVRAVAKAL